MSFSCICLDITGRVCSKTYAHTDAARKHAKKHHPAWLSVRDASRQPICCENIHEVAILASLRYGPRFEPAELVAPSAAVEHASAADAQVAQCSPARLQSCELACAMPDPAALQLQMSAIKGALMQPSEKAVAALRLFAAIEPTRAGEWERLLLSETVNVPRSRFFPSISEEDHQITSNAEVALVIVEAVSEHVDALPCASNSRGGA
ncbi:hypothetical protein KFE25_006665 [Diacronema lutheri]|uniref:C2H2-type domain-containing protein n=1 Tax=Diacronema lutheri TaxID=2081491 RepID=A0A8J5XHS0_DIALT|nr:hypothetical protein KFE25_006665 [Diacronema lutheri]